MAQTLLFIVNPRAGRTRSMAPLFEAVAHFSEEGYLVSVRQTLHPGHATELAEAEGGRFDRVVCFGGDGTLNEVVNGLMRLPSPPPLGYIPGGSTNDFAASLELSADPLTWRGSRICPPCGPTGLPSPPGMRFLTAVSYLVLSPMPPAWVG